MLDHPGWATWAWRGLLAVVLISLAAPAMAHSLRLFARVDGGQIGGYAFFIGGGRPAGVGWVAKMDGQTIAQGNTSDQGEYQFPVPEKVTGDISITVDTQEGHVAHTRLPADRFEDQPAAASTALIGAAASRAGSQEKDVSTPAEAGVDRQMIERAVAHEIAPLLERIEAMDARMRLTDVMSGVFLIIGLAGMGLWARRRKP